MSMRDVAVSSGARRRIRSFSVWVWVWGAIVLFIGALNTYTGVGFGNDGFAMLGDENPWEVEDPPLFEPDGDTYAGEGSGLIRIPLDEHNQEPYTASLLAGEYVDLFVTSAEDLGQPDDDRAYPSRIGDLYDVGSEAFVVPMEGDLELWIRTDGEWEITLAKSDVVEIENGFASGKGNALLVYRGDAVSARFVHKGDGIFFVTLQTSNGETDRPIIESGDVNERISWDPSTTVFVTIEADDGRGVWSIDIDELASDDPDDPNKPDPSAPEPTEPAEPTEPTAPATPDSPAALASATPPATTAVRMTAPASPRETTSR